MNPLMVVYFLLGLRLCSGASYTLTELKCQICKAVTTEMERAIARVSSSILADVGSHRLDEKGNKKTDLVPLIRSDTFLLDTMESACNEMEEYARGYDKKTMRLRVVRMKRDGVLNGEMSEIHAISDADLNESLKYYCEGLTDDHEDDFLRVFKSGNPDAIKGFCVHEIGVCEKNPEEEL